jgi:hypothetical protein
MRPSSSTNKSTILRSSAHPQGKGPCSTLLCGNCLEWFRHSRFRPDFLYYDVVINRSFQEWENAAKLGCPLCWWQTQQRHNYSHGQYTRPIHEGIFCRGSYCKELESQGPIVGTRYTCVDCMKELCEICKSDERNESCPVLRSVKKSFSRLEQFDTEIMETRPLITRHQKDCTTS